jgi:flagellar motor switch protein FliN/FliY
MLGQEGVELDEMALSTIGEAISNITGPSTTEIGNQIGQSIQTDNPESRRTPKGEISLPQEGSFVKVEYPLTVEGDMPATLVEVYPQSMVKEISSHLVSAPQAAAPELAGRGETGMFTEQQPAGGGLSQTFGQPIGEAAPTNQAPPPNVQPVQFANLQPSNIPSESGNIGLLMDVFMEMTVELGRTKKLIKEILTIGEGTIIELDKLAGEPVDILVNHKLIAKGEVVVIDENFGVRVTEIVSPIERMGDLT